MKKYLSFALIVVLAVFSFGRVTLAEETTAGASATTEAKPMPTELKQKIEAQREALKKQIEEKRNTIKTEIDAKRDTIKTEIEAKKDAFKADVGAKIDAFKTDLGLKRDALKADMGAKREAFKAELEAKKKEFQATLKTDREAFKTKLESERADFKANIKEKRAEFRGKAKEILSQRFEEAVKNITNVQTRVASVIEKMKAAGKDVSQAEVYLADSKTKLADAQAKLAEVRALIPTTDEQVTVENWEKIKQGANDVKALIKESHSDLVEAVKILKGLGKVEKPEESSDSSAPTSTVTQ